MRIRLPRLLAALAALASFSLPLSAQLGYGPEGGGEGFRLQVRPLGERWGPEIATGHDRIQGGRVGSGRPLDGLAIRNVLVPMRIQVETADGWLPWAEKGAKTGTEGKPILGVRISAGERAIRYRGSFVGKGVGEWAADGAAARAGGAPLEAIDVELLEGGPKGAAGFEYRVFFAGSGFTPWLKAGAIAEGKGPNPKATALEIRSGRGIRTEVFLERSGWQPTALEGETAGDPSGVRGIESIRFFSGPFPLRYRVRPERGEWGPWQDGGAEATNAGSGLRIEAIQLDVKRAAP